VVDDYARLPSVETRHVVAAPRGGFVARIDAESVGRASVVLGAGRDRVEDPIDPAVGILVRAKPGDQVSAGDAVFDVHYRDRARLDTALTLLNQAIVVGDERPSAGRLIVGEVR